MKRLNSALAQNGIFKSIAFVMLVLVATFSVALCMNSSSYPNEFGGSRGQEIRCSALLSNKNYFLKEDVGGKNSNGSLQFATLHDDVGGKGLGNLRFQNTDVGGGKTIGSNLSFSTDVGGKGTSIGNACGFASVNTDVGGGRGDQIIRKYLLTFNFDVGGSGVKSTSGNLLYKIDLS
jgi:hypothetical protein